MSYPTFRRRRRRRALIVVIVAAVVAILVVAVTLARSDRQASREYLDAAFDVVTGEEDLAAQFDDIVTRLPEMERPVVAEALDRLAADAEVLVDEMGRLEVPGTGDHSRADSFLRIALASWRDGLTGFNEAILTLSEDPLDENGSAQLEAAISELQVGDAAYEEFRATVRVALEIDTLATPFPAVEFIPVTDIEAYTTDSIVRDMLQAPGLGVITNLGIADIKLEPSATGERNGIPVVPVSESLSAEATISNSGTVAVNTIVVTLTMVSNEGERYEANQGIERLEPGELTTVTFTDLPVQGGRTYEITFALGGQDDDPTDNRETFRFIRNADE
jgi:hypothetical protein